jgi:hypothetical protein
MRERERYATTAVIRDQVPVDSSRTRPLAQGELQPLLDTMFTEQLGFTTQQTAHLLDGAVLWVAPFGANPPS